MFVRLLGRSIKAPISVTMRRLDAKDTYRVCYIIVFKDISPIRSHICSVVEISPWRSLGRSSMNVSDFRWLPAKLFQTNITDHEESKLNMARYASQFKRYFYDDQACRDYLKDTFGPDVVSHISSYKKGAHRADAFRYGLILQEGGLYLDIKIAMLDDFSRLLQEIDITGELQGEPFILIVTFSTCLL